MITEIYEMDNFYYIMEINKLDEEVYRITECFNLKDNPELFRFSSRMLVENYTIEIEDVLTKYKTGLHTLASLFDKVFDSKEDKKLIYKELYLHLKYIYQVDLEQSDLYS